MCSIRGHARRGRDIFLPIKILHPYERTPWATYAILGINVLAYFATLSGDDTVLRFALDTENFAPWQLLTALFLHADLLHLVGNMWFLVICGRYVEDRLGPLRFVGGYLLFGLFADLFFLAFSEGPAVGASGAISGLMGFILVGAPWVEVRMLLLISARWVAMGRSFQTPAFWIMLFWFGLDLFGAWTSGSHGGTAYSAHIGGFLAGAAAAAFLRSETCKGTDWWLDPSPPGGGEAATRRLTHARGRGKQSARSTPEAELAWPVEFRSVANVASDVALMKVLMRHLGLWPEKAKARVEAVRGGEPQSFDLGTEEAAASLAAAARALGAEVELRGPPPPPPPPKRQRRTPSPGSY